MMGQAFWFKSELFDFSYHPSGQGLYTGSVEDNERLALIWEPHFVLNSRIESSGRNNMY
jgi:hypothetical protein